MPIPDNIVRVEISGELILNVLHFPKGTKIVRRLNDPTHPDRICLVLEHPDLPEVKPGEVIPRANPVFFSKGGKITDFDWNPKKDNEQKP